MSIGPGKYDDICTAARDNAMAEGALVIIFNGKRGSGFSAQLSFELMAQIPTILRDTADQIEKSMPKT
jgi:hypothetical protein